MSSMQSTFSHFWQKLASAIVCAGLLVGCTTFRGPGGLNLSYEEDVHAPEQDSEPSPFINRDPSQITGFLPTPDQPMKFDWPVDDARLTRGFLSQKSRKKRAHWGLDLANKKGTPILSAAKGTVVYTGHAFRGYGKLIVIEHSNEWATLYSHLDKIVVKEGDSVDRGQKIGLMGRTGRATGVHLHFEVRRHRQPVNPLAYLPKGADRELASQLAKPSRWIQLSMKKTAPGEPPDNSSGPQPEP